MKPSYKFLDHTADVLFQAEAATLPELFEQCALALQETQVDISAVEPRQSVSITGENKNIDYLLFDFLDNLLFYKDSAQLVFSTFEAHIEQHPGGVYSLHCTAKGEKLNVKKHHPKVDVKAITMHMFEVKKVKEGWKAQVLVDI
ncbi:archease [Candidatus Woesearchaeota archaeon]|nr:archease [Candidatus Woesearchaeota archaeon]